MVCKKCGFPLGPKEIYCTKCGFNNMMEYKGEKKEGPHDTIHYHQTAAQEKERYTHTNRGMAVTLIICLIFILFLWYSVLSGMWTQNLSSLFSISKENFLPLLLCLLSTIIIVESIISYRYPDDNYFKSLFKYAVVLLVVYGGFTGYTFIQTHVFSLEKIQWFSFLKSCFLMGTAYFISKTIVWKGMEHWMSHNYIVYFLLYYVVRIFLWIGILLLTNYVLPL